VIVSTSAHVNPGSQFKPENPGHHYGSRGFSLFLWNLTIVDTCEDHNNQQPHKERKENRWSI